MADQKAVQLIGTGIDNSIGMWNTTHNRHWNYGTNYSNVGTEFETYVNKFLFPKIRETLGTIVKLGNRFEWLAREIPQIAEFDEEYVFMDNVPLDLDLSKTQVLMFKRNYAKMATHLYGRGVHKTFKFTINDNDNRMNWSTLGDAIKYVANIYIKYVSDVNYQEEQEIRAMLIDYAVNNLSANQKIAVSDIDEAIRQTNETMLNLQDSSNLYNEVATASGGSIGRYTTRTDLSNIMILTDNKTKVQILDTKIANVFQVAGLDITNHIVSFNTLGGVFKTTKDIKITERETLNYFASMGDYQSELGDIIPEGATFTFDISKLAEFDGGYKEVKPDSETFIFLLDARSIRYRRNTSKLIPYHRYNDAVDEHDYTSHYYSQKAVSPFYNKILIEVQ